MASTGFPATRQVKRQRSTVTTTATTTTVHQPGGEANLIIPDLSQVTFIATANNPDTIAIAVMLRIGPPSGLKLPETSCQP